MPDVPENKTDYCCIHCMSPLQHKDSSALYYRGCRRSFPIINGIPILTLRPREMLMVHLQEFKLAQAAIENKRDLLSQSGITNGTVFESSARAARMLHGMTQNLSLIERYMKPIEDYLIRNGNQPSNLIDWALAQNVGAVPQIMLPFFYQDWARTKDFKEAESLIVGALREHRPDDETAAILGVGAYGIACACASHFHVVYGLDLSVPTLLMAQAVLDGKTLEFYLPHAGWRRVQVMRAKLLEGQIRLVAADIGTLPFAEGSLAAVVTQYVMDLAGNPLGVAAEIQRVLKPGGIWINFSNPFRLPGDPPELAPPEPSELAGLLEPIGLDIIKAERRRFTLWNVNNIYEGGHRNVHEVHFFIARKPARPRPLRFARQSKMWDQQDDDWWRRVPRIVPGKEIQIIRKRVFGPVGMENHVEIALNAVSLSVSAEHTALAEALFSHIDGKHTLLEILCNLEAQGMAMSQTQFRELIYCLLNQYCVIRLDNQQLPMKAFGV
jgi:SAM-dependent methyltransferase